MKIIYSLAALCATTSAFSLGPHKAPRVAFSSTALASTPYDPAASVGAIGAAPRGDWDLGTIAGGNNKVLRVEGSSRKTFDFPDLNQDTIQLAMNTQGRPLDAAIEVWIGPDWTPYKLRAFSEDGRQFPIQSLVGTRGKSATLELRNVAQYEMPFNIACDYAKGSWATARDTIANSGEGRLVQGGSVYTVDIEPGIRQARVFLNTDTRQLFCRVELLNGPNNIKQTYEIFTNNGVLNSFYAVFDCYGTGNVIRITNVAPVEFPAYAFVAPV